MHRTCCAVLFGLTLAGCQAPAERLPVMPLPTEGQTLPYTDGVTRARVWASAANEAFYLNEWADLDRAAIGLEKTADFLPKSPDVPAKSKDKVVAMSAALIKDAGQLRAAAKAKDVKAANLILQRINLKVRELRLDG